MNFFPGRSDMRLLRVTTLSPMKTTHDYIQERMDNGWMIQISSSIILKEYIALLA